MKISDRTIWLCFALLVFLSGLVKAQTVPVVPVPYPQFVSYLQNGEPNAFGCVFTYQANTTTQLGTYTDGFSNTLNPNPVPLSAGGTASIWLQVGSLYTLVIKTSGGVNCASGQTLYSVNGLGGGATTQTIAVPFSATPIFTASSQNTLFTITLTGNAVALPLATVGLLAPAYITFQITQDATGGRTFIWPSNMVGGAPIGLNPNQVTTQEFVWNGTSATALGPAVTGNGPALSTGNIVGATISGTSVATYVSIPNAGTTGTALNTLTKLSGAPSTGVIAAITDAAGIIGICVAQCGITGTAIIQQSGSQLCVFDGATTAGDYVKISSGTAGDCSDAGASYLVSGQIIGRVLSTNGSGGTYPINLYGPSTTGTSVLCSVSGSVNASTTAQQLITSCPFAPGALNVAGKAFLIKMSVSMTHASSENSSVYIAFGNTVPTALISWVQASESASAASYHAVSDISCRVSVPGALGTILCSAIGAVSNGTAITMAGTGLVTTSIGTNDLTGNVFFGPMCSFSVASASNICSLDYFIIEQLN